MVLLDPGRAVRPARNNNLRKQSNLGDLDVVSVQDEDSAPTSDFDGIIIHFLSQFECIATTIGSQIIFCELAIFSIVADRADAGISRSPMAFNNLKFPISLEWSDVEGDFTAGLCTLGYQLGSAITQQRRLIFPIVSDASPSQRVTSIGISVLRVIFVNV